MPAPTARPTHFSHISWSSSSLALSWNPAPASSSLTASDPRCDPTVELAESEEVASSEAG